MAFYDRVFEVYAVLGNPAASPPPWVASKWARMSDALDPLMKAARGRPAVRVYQTSPGPGSPNKRDILFGRIGWNARGAGKWTHSTDGRLASGGEAI
jgi:hypothetical protein